MRHVLPILILGFALAACGDGTDAPPADPGAASEVLDRAPAPDTGDGVLALAAANPQLDTFLRAVEAAGMAEELAQEGPITIFAPSDEAFAQFADLDALLADPEALAERLRGHVLTTRMLAVDVFAPIGIETVAGTEIEVDSPAPGEVTVRSAAGSATVTDADLDASNGVIHIIDTVL